MKTFFIVLFISDVLSIALFYYLGHRKGYKNGLAEGRRRAREAIKALNE